MKRLSLPAVLVMAAVLIPVTIRHDQPKVDYFPADRIPVNVDHTVRPAPNYAVHPKFTVQV